MENGRFFREKNAAGRFVLGTGITYTDPTVGEMISPVADLDQNLEIPGLDGIVLGPIHLANSL